MRSVKTSRRLAKVAARGALIVLLGALLVLPVQAQNVCATKASLVNPMTVEPSGLGGYRRAGQSAGGYGEGCVALGAEPGGRASR
jgi:hypothetical protein